MIERKRERRIKRDAYKAGQLAMRERAAHIAELKSAVDPDALSMQEIGYSMAANEITCEIRALEPEEPN